MKLKVAVTCEQEFTKEEMKAGWEKRVEDFKYQLRKVIEEECGVEDINVTIQIVEE